jgi:hypothetical protein
MLLKTVTAAKLDPRPLITHRFELDEIERAYDTFANAAKERASRSSWRRRWSAADGEPGPRRR